MAERVLLVLYSTLSAFFVFFAVAISIELNDVLTGCIIFLLWLQLFIMLNCTIICGVRLGEINRQRVVMLLMKREEKFRVLCALVMQGYVYAFFTVLFWKHSELFLQWVAL